MAKSTPLYEAPSVQRVLFLAVVALCFLTETCLGQGASDRYQLGRRLERFELAWEQAPTELRAKSTGSMEQAVQSFFSLQLSRAGKLLDQAWLQVSGAEGTELTERLESIRWRLDFDSTLLDLKHPIIKGRASVFYDEQPEAKSKLTIVLHVWPWDDSPAKVMLSQATREPLLTKTLELEQEQAIELDLSGLPPGDYVLTGHAQGTEPGKFDWICPSFSLIDRLEERLKKLELWGESNRPAGKNKEGKDQAEDTPGATSGSTAKSTARFLAREINRGRKGTSFEIDLPWNKLLEDFEQMTQPADQGGVEGDFNRWIRKPGSKWMQLGLGRSTQVLRMEVPDCDLSDPKKKLPILIALHGAGGSENMFFQTYGAGRLVDLGKERQWLVVSPRQTMTGLGLDVPQMVQALAQHLPVDPQRVMLIGHSMGAAQAMSQVGKHPESVSMVAALGGGGSVRDTESIRKIPFYVAAGDRDFGKPRAKALSQQLQRIGASVQYREFQDVEHMVIVQAALDDVFEFFDRGGK